MIIKAERARSVLNLMWAGIALSDPIGTYETDPADMMKDDECVQYMIDILGGFHMSCSLHDGVWGMCLRD